MTIETWRVAVWHEDAVTAPMFLRVCVPCSRDFPLFGRNRENAR